MLICNVLLATKDKIAADKISGLVRCQSSRMEGHGLMNMLDSFEQKWFNTPNCEAIYLPRNKTIIFWNTRSTAGGSSCKVPSLRRSRPFGIASYGSLPVLWQKGLILALAKDLLVKTGEDLS